ncbi:hypothetical protein [Desulfuromonas versatilis]|nr:hypothetical protein [Desulfuromonas versatilis]
MKNDLAHKTAILGRHVPGFLGYSAISYRETDRLLCRHLARELEKVRDRLADFIASGRAGEGLAEDLGALLQQTARVKAEVARGQLPAQAGPWLSSSDEERLVDFDFALLDKIVALHTPLERMEAAAAVEEVERAAALYRQGLLELEALFRERGQVLSGA